MCLGYVCSGGVVVLHSKEYTHEMYNIFPKIFFSYAATCAGSSSFKLAAIATRLLRAWKKDEKSSKQVIWEKCFGMYGSICIPHAGNLYSQSDNNSRSKHEKWDKRQHPRKDQISQLQFLSISKQ